MSINIMFNGKRMFPADNTVKGRPPMPTKGPLRQIVNDENINILQEKRASTPDRE